jgi:lipopolysaccharide/colanic/teichoic acid biosynthesis glycosyltransferase
VTAVGAVADVRAAATHPPTIWGLTPVEVYDRFWASRGVAVVRRGESGPLTEAAELYLLTAPDTLVVFRLRDLVELLSWLRPSLVVVRLKDKGHRDYHERVLATPEGRLIRSERIYDGPAARLARIGVTPSRALALAWRDASSDTEGWRTLRRTLRHDERVATSLPGRLFDARRDEHLMAQLEYVMATWAAPDSTIPRARHGPARTWIDRDARVAEGASLVGTIWVGAGRSIESQDTVLGPAILWDDPNVRPESGGVAWQELTPIALQGGGFVEPRYRRSGLLGKRVFDVVFSIVALSLTLPLYPLIALAIWLEDGRPIFFAHRRETRGGWEFRCFKFRSMRRDAERAKAALASKNVADGPQFYVEHDPRSTRVGRFLRATQLDEIPQFFNVLMGDMSIVGPRPSPRRENQFCPAWREARLSVRPGITGLWQIRRTRAEGRDFQEWIQYDLEYVQRMSWRLDLWILWRTVVTVVRQAFGR